MIDNLLNKSVKLLFVLYFLFGSFSVGFSTACIEGESSQGDYDQCLKDEEEKRLVDRIMNDPGMLSDDPSLASKLSEDQLQSAVNSRPSLLLDLDSNYVTNLITNDITILDKLPSEDQVTVLNGNSDAKVHWFSQRAGIEDLGGEIESIDGDVVTTSGVGGTSFNLNELKDNGIEATLNADGSLTFPGGADTSLGEVIISKETIKDGDGNDLEILNFYIDGSDAELNIEKTDNGEFILSNGAKATINGVEYSGDGNYKVVVLDGVASVFGDVRMHDGMSAVEIDGSASFELQETGETPTEFDLESETRLTKFNVNIVRDGTIEEVVDFIPTSTHTVTADTKFGTESCTSYVGNCIQLIDDVEDSVYYVSSEADVSSGFFTNIPLDVKVDIKDGSEVLIGSVKEVDGEYKSSDYFIVNSEGIKHPDLGEAFDGVSVCGSIDTDYGKKMNCIDNVGSHQMKSVIVENVWFGTLCEKNTGYSCKIGEYKYKVLGDCLFESKDKMTYNCKGERVDKNGVFVYDNGDSCLSDKSCSDSSQKSFFDVEGSKGDYVSPVKVWNGVNCPVNGLRNCQIGKYKYEPLGNQLYKSYDNEIFNSEGDLVNLEGKYVDRDGNECLPDPSKACATSSQKDFFSEGSRAETEYSKVSTEKVLSFGEMTFDSEYVFADLSLPSNSIVFENGGKADIYERENNRYIKLFRNGKEYEYEVVSFNGVDVLKYPKSGAYFSIDGKRLDSNKLLEGEFEIVGESTVINKGGSMPISNNENLVAPTSRTNSLTESERNRRFELVSELAIKYNIEPEDLWHTIGFETIGSYSTTIQSCSKCGVGIFQFTQLALDDIYRVYKDDVLDISGDGSKLTKNDLKEMTFSKQLQVADLYLKLHTDAYNKNINSNGDVYLTIFAPHTVGKKDNYIAYKSGSDFYKLNDGMDINNDGKITKSEILKRYKSTKQAYLPPTIS